MVLSPRNRKWAKEIVAIGLKGLDAQAHSFFSKRIENNRSLMTRFFSSLKLRRRSSFKNHDKLFLGLLNFFLTQNFLPWKMSKIDNVVTNITKSLSATIKA